MHNLLATTLLLSGLFTVTQAAEKYDTRALRIVTKLCTPCHGTPFYMAKQIDDDDWKYYFKKKGKLISIHKNEPKGVASLKNALFTKHEKRLMKFLVDNSKFSGVVHGCDSNFCGTHH